MMQSQASSNDKASKRAKLLKAMRDDLMADKIESEEEKK